MIAMLGNGSMGISNRNLNEVAIYMKKNGYALVARRDIIPIILKTAEEKRAIAVIKSKKIQSHVKNILRKMTEPAAQAFADFGKRTTTKAR